MLGEVVKGDGHTHLYKTWQKRLNQILETDHVIKESWINAIKHLCFKHVAVAEWRQTSSMNEIEIKHFYTTFQYRVMKENPQKLLVSQEQTEKGLKWLNSQRKHIATSLISILDDFDHFEFCGYTVSYDDMSRPEIFTIYRVVGKDGRFFDYTMRHWCSISIIGK